VRSPLEALARILAAVDEVPARPAERVALADALGRSLAETLRATSPMPAFDASTMDGYALRAADARRAGARLPVAFEVAAGHPARAPLPRGACCRIFTGAPLPAGADAVEMQEQVARHDGVATFARAAEPGRFVRLRGDDVPKGAVALEAGRVLDPGGLGLVASLGRSALRVRRRPRVLVLPTGDELVPPGVRPGPGQVVESNAIALAAAVTEAGGLAEVLPIARDEPGALRTALRRVRGADVLLTIGGVSVGERDLVRQALGKAGAQLDFWRVALRPGKPFLFGSLGRALVFGLPGNPASALVTFELFVRPALRRMAGLPGSGRVSVVGRLTQAQEKPPELTVVLRVRAVRRGGTIELSPLRTQLSGNLSSVTGHDALAFLPPGPRRLPAGARVEALLLRPPTEG
jgi:molybdopterin molybdotransferase